MAAAGKGRQFVYVSILPMGLARQINKAVLDRRRLGVQTDRLLAQGLDQLDVIDALILQLLTELNPGRRILDKNPRRIKLLAQRDHRTQQVREQVNRIHCGGSVSLVTSWAPARATIRTSFARSTRKTWTRQIADRE